VIEQVRAGLVLLAALVAVGPANANSQFAGDPEVGNNAFTAVFDTPIGERITAVSSAVGCTLTVEEARLEGKAHCSVPLASVRVDNDDTKTEHFGQWDTNKQIDPKQCTFELEVPAVKLYRWTDDQGVVHLTNLLDQVPPQYRQQVKPPKPGCSESGRCAGAC